jgi:hypothetical protein
MTHNAAVAHTVSHVNVNDKILNIAHITIKDICALHLSKFELQQTISNFKKVSLELSLEGSGSCGDLEVEHSRRLGLRARKLARRTWCAGEAECNL